MKPTRIFSCGLFAALLIHAPAAAADSTWTGSALDAFWTTSTNWAGSVVPGDTASVTGTATGNSDVATFNHNLNTVITVDEGRNLKSLVFQPGVDAYTLQTGTLVLSEAGTVAIQGGVIRPQTIASQVRFVPVAASAIFTNNALGGGVTLDFTGGVTGQRPAGNTTGLVLNGIADGTISGPLGNGAEGGKLSIAKGGAGTWSLSGTNTFSGGITANNGLLVLDHAESSTVADPASPLSLGGGTLVVRGRGTGTTSLALGSLTLALSKGESTLVVDKNGGAGTTLTLGSTWTRNTGATLLLDLSSGGILVSSPTQTDKVITGSSTAASFLVRDASGKTDYAARDAENRIVRLDTVASAVTAYGTGSAAAVTTKNYRIDADTTLAAGTNTFGTLRIEAAANPVAVTLGTVNLLLGKAVMVIDGTKNVSLTSDAGTGGGKLGSGGIIFANYNSATTTLAARIGGSSGTTAGSYMGTGLTVLDFDNSGQDGASTLQGGLLRLAQAKSLPTGNLAIQNGGILELGAADFTRGLGTTSSLVQFNSGSGGFSAYGAPRTANLGGAGAALTWGSFLADGSALILGSRVSDHTLTFANAINLNDGNRVVQVNDGTVSGDVDAVLGAVVSSSNPAAGILTKTGSGTLALTAGNTYTGGTRVLGGQLHLGTGGTAGSIASAGTITNDAVLVVNRSNAINLGSAIIGSGELRQIGAGKTTLSGANTFTGTTTASSGTLAGTGSAASDLIVQAATLEPGINVGTYHAASATLSPQSAMVVQIDGPSADRLQATGAIHLAGFLTVSPQGDGVTSSSYIIAEGASITGAFSGVTAGFRVTYTATQAILGVVPTYVDWAAQWAPTQAETADHDGDGVPNGIEYFLGETGNSRTTMPGLVSINGGLTITWPKGPSYHGYYGLDHMVQTSADMKPEGQPGGWTDVPAALVADTASSLAFTLGNGEPKTFVRLKTIVRAVPSIIPTPPSRVPPMPLGLAMTVNSTSAITLTWYSSPVNDDAASIYKIYGSSSSTGPFTQIGTSTARSFTEGGLATDAKRYYKVAASNVVGDSAGSAVAQGFTIVPSDGSALPVLIAKNMCVSLGSTIISTVAPSLGSLSSLVDGKDATSCGITGAHEVRIKLNNAVSLADADYLMVNFRTDQTGQSYAYNINWRSLKTYTITESFDSTDGVNGTWSDVVTGTNGYLDGVIVIPNHEPKWIGVKNSSGFQMCRLDVFRSAPAGYRNDYWIFAGDSLVVQDMVGGAANAHGVWFSDLVRQRHPDRYPIMVNSSQGGEVMANTTGRLANQLPVCAGPNGTATPTGTFLCFETGFNDVGVGGGLYMGPQIIQNLTNAQNLCNTHGMFLVPVRIEFSNHYLNPDTLEPTTYNIFYNTLAVNLAGVDVYTRKYAPYACDPVTQLPYADYWTYTRQNHATALASDGVHHTRAGCDGINTLWADVAGKMVYLKQP